MEWKRELAARLTAAKHGQAGKIIEEYEQLTGKSRDALYRVAKANGYTSGRKKRQDKGALKSGLSEYQLQYVSALMQATERQVKGVIMTVEKALEIAVDNDVIQPGQVSASRLQSILKERSMNKAALDSDTPSIRMKSLHPNYCHIFDASICIQYRLKKGKGLAILDERDFRAKKPKNFDKIKQRLIRMVLVDHYSGTIFVKYYVAAGENQRITYDFLTSAWRGIGHSQYPQHGVPFHLLMDAGSANIAKGILAFLKALEIKIPLNMPHNPRRQGSAEGAQNIVERQFECTLHLEPAYTIEELNAWAHDWMVHYNATRIHSRHKMTRTACWLKIQREQLRELPEDSLLHEIYSEPVITRTVRQDKTITIDNEDYQLKDIPGIRPKVTVEVRRRPYHLPQVAILFNDEEYLVDPIGKDANGFRDDAAVIGIEYKAQAETEAQKVRKLNENLAYGEERQRGALPFGGTVIVHGNQAAKLGNMTALPKRGTPMEVGRDLVAQNMPISDFLKKLRDAAGRISPEMNRDLKEYFGTTIDVNQADFVINAIASGQDWREDEASQAQA